MPVKQGSTVDLQDFNPYIDFERFKSFPCTLNETTLAIATDKYILMAGVPQGPPSQRPFSTESPLSADEEDFNSQTRLVLEYKQASCKPSLLTWIDENLLCIGFEHGLVLCFDSNGNEVFQFQGTDSYVQAVKLFDEQGAPSLWILYESKLIVAVLLDDALNSRFCDAIGFQLTGQEACHDFVVYPCPFACRSEWDLDDAPNAQGLRLVVSGFNAALSLYEIDMKRVRKDFKRSHATQAASASQTSSSLTKTLFSFVSSFSGVGATDAASSRKRDSDTSLWSRSDRTATLTAKASFLDEKRRILRLSMDPLKRLIACADTLGRVTLWDAENECIVRIWKGLRDAHLGWIVDLESTLDGNGSRSLSHSSSSAVDGPASLKGNNMNYYNSNNNKNNNTQHTPPAVDVMSERLVIFAPLLGLVSLYQMRNGPCLRVIPVGMNCRLVPMCSFASQQNPNLLFNAIPIRCEAEHSSLEVLSYQREDGGAESELALIVDMMEEEVLRSHTEEDDHDATEPHKALSQDTEDAFVRHTDMVHSIHEALLANKKHRQQESFFADETKRLLRVFRLSNSPLTCNETNTLSKTETKILAILQQCSSKAVLRLLAMVEQAELRGFSSEIGLESHRESGAVTESPALRLSGLRFSIAFHEKINEIMRDRIEEQQEQLANETERERERERDRENEKKTNRDKTNRDNKPTKPYWDAELVNSLRMELDARVNLLRAFEQLAKSNAQLAAENALSLTHTNTHTTSTQQTAAGSVSGGGRVLLSDDPAVLCRQNNSRAEALCWTLRQLRKQGKDPLSQALTPLLGVNGNMSRSRNPSAPNSPLVATTFRADSVIEPQSPIRGVGMGSSIPVNASTPTPAVVSYNKVEGKHTTLLQLSSSAPPSKQHTPLSVPPSSPERVQWRRRFDPVDFSASHTQTQHTALSSHTQPPQASFGGDVMNFSVFRAMHSQRRDHDGEFSYFPRLDEVQALLARHFNNPNPAQDADGAPSESLLSVSNCVSIDALAHTARCDKTHTTPPTHTHSERETDKHTQHITHSDNTTPHTLTTQRSLTSHIPLERSDTILVSLSPHITLDLLHFLFLSLVGDLESYKSFNDALKFAGSFLSGPMGLKTLLPGFFVFLSQQPLESVMYDVMSRKVSSSPFQRWIRDQLLTFQDMVSNYNRFLRVKLHGELNRERVDALRESDVDEEELDLFVFHSVTHIRKEFLSQRSIGEAKLESAIPSFDEYVRHLLRPVLLECRQNFNLELVMGFAAVLLETLCGVHEQIERRTYGADHLSTCIASWQLLLKQVRVLLFLRSRVYLRDPLPDSLFTVKNVHDGTLSLHKILAMDTLEFALRGNQALEHEARCREVYQKRRQATVDAPPPPKQVSSPSPSHTTQRTHSITTSTEPATESATASAEVLLAWGAVADKRWRDVLAVAVAEDAIDHSLQDTAVGAMKTSSSGTAAVATKKLGKRRRKPLLLFFPEHNQSVFLGCYRCLLLSARWWKKADSMELLAVMCEHLCELPREWRAVVSLEIYKRSLFPVLQIMLAMEEDVSVSHTTFSHNKLRHQILTLMSDATLLKSFALLGMEVLNYVLEVLPQSGECLASDVLSLSTTAALPLDTLRREDELRDSLFFETQRDSFAEHGGVSASSALSESHGAARRADGVAWPALVDRALVELFVGFYTPHCSSGASVADGTERNTESEKNEHTEGKTEREREEDEKNKKTKYIDRSASRELVLFHMTIWYTMTLRFQCGLRGVKVSQLVGEKPLREIVSGCMYGESREITAEMIDGDWRQIRLNIDENEDTHRVRGEFLARCFCRLVVVESMPQILYNLGASLWSFEMDILRLLHVYALVDSGDKDNEIEDVISKFNDANLAVDLLLSIARQRLGHTLRQMESVPSYGPLLAGMDAEALQWARQSAAASAARGAASSVLSLHAMAAHSPGGASSPLAHTSRSNVSGNRSVGTVVVSDVSSTRRLLLYVQSVLFDVPFNERESVVALDLSSRPARRLSLLLHFTRYRSWVERKSRCDALLSLCQALAPLSSSASKKRDKEKERSVSSASAATLSTSSAIV